MRVEEFQELPDWPPGRRSELVRGVLIEWPLRTARAGQLGVGVGSALHEFLLRHSVGSVTGAGGYLLAEDPDTVRAPSTAWLSSDRRERETNRRTGYFKGAPDLAVEVVAEHDHDADVADKVADFLSYGSQRVWVVRPRRRTVTVHRANGVIHEYSAVDTLTSDDAGFPVVGFKLPVSAIFE